MANLSAFDFENVKDQMRDSNNLEELHQSKFGRRVLLQLLHPNCQKYVPLNLQQIMQPPAKPASGLQIVEGQVRSCFAAGHLHCTAYQLLLLVMCTTALLHGACMMTACKALISTYACLVA